MASHPANSKVPMLAISHVMMAHIEVAAGRECADSIAQRIATLLPSK